MLAALLVGLIYPTAVIAEVQIQTIVLTGQAAPNGNGTFVHLDRGTLNEVGQVAFRGILENTIAGNMDNQAIFRGDGGPLTEIVRRSDAAPDGNGAFLFLDTALRLNSAGQVAFLGNLFGTSGGITDDVGIFRGEGGLLTQVVRRGQSAPGVGSFSFFWSNTLSNSGKISFYATIASPVSSDAGIFLADNGTLTQIVRRGQQAPNGTFSLTFAQYPAINEAGQISFGDDGLGMFRGNGTTITPIALRGQSPPDGNGTFAFEFGGQTNMNNAGQVMFRTFVSGTSGGSSDNFGLFYGSGGALTQIVRKGQSAPDGNGIFGGIVPFEGWSLNNAGQVAFSANLVGTSGGSDDSGGIFLFHGGILKQIVRAGQPAPGGIGLFSSFGFFPALNDLGHLAFVADLVGTIGGDLDNRALYFADGLDLIQILRTGQLLDVGSADVRTIEDIDFVGSGAFNNSGQMAVTLIFTDGSRGHFIATVPEPTGVSWLVAGTALALCRRRSDR